MRVEDGDALAQVVLGEARVDDVDRLQVHGLLELQGQLDLLYLADRALAKTQKL